MVQRDSDYEDAWRAAEYGARKLISDAKRYWWDEPKKVGERAESMAAERYGRTGDWTRSNAAKHMAWQAELADRTHLPKVLAVPVANAIGVGKELIIDGIGSTGLFIAGRGDNPSRDFANMPADIKNNFVGASRLIDAPDKAEAAVELAREAKGGGMLRALANADPYATEEEE